MVICDARAGNVIILLILACLHVGCGNAKDASSADPITGSKIKPDPDSIIVELDKRLDPLDYLPVENIDQQYLSIRMHKTMMARLQGLDLNYEPDKELWENTLDYINGNIRESMFLDYLGGALVPYSTHGVSYLTKMSQERDDWASFYYLKLALTASNTGKSPEPVEFDAAPESARVYQHWYRMGVENNWGQPRKDHRMTANIAESIMDRTTHGPTLALLAFYYLAGKTPYQTVDPEKARQMIRRAKGSATSDKDHPVIDYMDASIDIFHGDEASQAVAFQTLKGLVEKGFIPAQNLLGECYRFGVGTEKKPCFGNRTLSPSRCRRAPSGLLYLWRFTLPRRWSSHGQKKGFPTVRAVCSGS